MKREKNDLTDLTEQLIISEYEKYLGLVLGRAYDRRWWWVLFVFDDNTCVVLDVPESSFNYL